MRIDETAMQHLMNVVTDMYEDPILAFIREYSTNALDSHIEAGQSRPIEVTTPTDLRPLFTVRDYGVGLDADDIREVYSMYGKSTKRATNDAVGMLGLGCKSALAAVDQFTVTGIKDGQRIQVSVARDETGAGTMTVLEAGPTDEPDGVEVAIPAGTYSEVEAKAHDFFSYWKPGTVLLNGEPPNELEGYIVGDYIVAERDTSYSARGRHDGNKLTIVMGNVSYPPPQGYEHEAVESLPQDRRIVVNVAIGTVNFTPSREALQDAPRTREAIDATLNNFQTEIAAAVTDAIVSAPDRPAAARALIEAREAFGKKNVPDLQWRGEDIPTVLSAEDIDPLPSYKPGETIPASLWTSRIVNSYRGGESHRSPAGQVSLDDAGKNPWILGYDNAKWTATQRRKFDRYLEHHGLHDDPRKATILITDGKTVPRPEWIDGAVLAIEWATVREWKDPEAGTGGLTDGGGGVKYAGTYPTIIAGRWHEKHPADDLPKSGRNLYYVEGGKWTTLQGDVAAVLSDKAIIVCLTGIRAKKFKRLFPHARDGVAVAKKAAASWYAALSDERKRAIVLADSGAWGYGAITGLPSERIDDPELSALLRADELWEGGLSDEWNKREAFIDADTLPDKPDEVEWETVFERYPLVRDLYQRRITDNLDHAILYINAVYAANVNESEDADA